MQRRVSCFIAERTGLEEDGKQAPYYVITLAMVGCVAETRSWLGLRLRLARWRLHLCAAQKPIVES